MPCPPRSNRWICRRSTASWSACCCSRGPVPREAWLRHAADIDGRAVPAGVPVQALNALVLRRHAELERAISERAWFDPWVFELEAEAGSAECPPSQAVLPWVAGLAAALERFPALLQIDDPALHEPLAVLYAHFDPEDLDDADELRPLIDEIEPPDSLSEAVAGSGALHAAAGRRVTPAQPGPAPAAAPLARQARPARRRGQRRARRWLAQGVTRVDVDGRQPHRAEHRGGHGDPCQGLQSGLSHGGMNRFWAAPVASLARPRRGAIPTTEHANVVPAPRSSPRP